MTENRMHASNNSMTLELKSCFGEARSVLLGDPWDSLVLRQVSQAHRHVVGHEDGTKQCQCTQPQTP